MSGFKFLRLSRVRVGLKILTGLIESLVVSDCVSSAGKKGTTTGVDWC